MEKKVHLYFSISMSLFMVTIMSLVVTIVNLGFNSGALTAWFKSGTLAWLIAFPLIYFFSPMIRKVVMKKVGA